jgi:methylisocitrate lyase
MIRAGVAAMHIEDQEQAKRCGHRPNKAIVSSGEMCDRIKSAVDARTDEGFVVMARTDAVAREGVESAISRSQAYVEAGADMIFAEALTSLGDYRAFCSSLDVPVLANMTEFGMTPTFSRDEFAQTGVSMVLYPLSAFRAMSKAALNVYETILQTGTQESLLDTMQTRDELYDVLNYHDYERRLDALFAGNDSDRSDDE